METAGKHIWAVKKVEQPAYSISNYLSLNDVDRMHANTIVHAREAGYCVEEPFNWNKTYANWESLGRSGMLRRACSLQQMMRPGGRFEITDMLAALRTHYCNDEWTEGMH